MTPSSTALIAGSASGFIFIHHCFETSGSTTVRQRWHLPTLSLYGSIFFHQAERFEIGHDLLASVVTIEASVFAGGRWVILAPPSIT